MRRLIFAIVLALFLLVLVVFVLSNSDMATFGYPMVFKFNVPFLPFASETKPVQVGYVMLIAFCVGMITTPFLEALPSLYKTLELRAKNKRIRQLERELTLVREMMTTEHVRTAQQPAWRGPTPLTPADVDLPPVR